MKIGFGRRHRAALAIYLVILAATWWRPGWPAEQALHHSLSLAALLAAAWLHRRYPLPLSSWLLFLVFLALHTIAARWIYSFVPYDDWLKAITGRTTGWERNNFDRIVHLFYGLCATPILVRYLRDTRATASRSAALLAVQFVLATSALYELFEWLIAITASPETAEAYNGQQGDPWDAQKDMALAALGSALTALPFLAKARDQDTPPPPDRPSIRRRANQ